MVFHIFSLRIEVQVQKKERDFVRRYDVDPREETRDKIFADYSARRFM
jgi:hypothetical protein